MSWLKRIDCSRKFLDIFSIKMFCKCDKVTIQYYIYKISSSDSKLNPCPLPKHILDKSIKSLHNENFKLKKSNFS